MRARRCSSLRVQALKVPSLWWWATSPLVHHHTMRKSSGQSLSNRLVNIRAFRRGGTTAANIESRKVASMIGMAQGRCMLGALEECRGFPNQWLQASRPKWGTAHRGRWMSQGYSQTASPSKLPGRTLQVCAHRARLTALLCWILLPPEVMAPQGRS